MSCSKCGNRRYREWCPYCDTETPADRLRRALDDSYCEEVLAMSDSEVEQEIRDLGLDPAEEAGKAQAIFEEAVQIVGARR